MAVYESVRDLFFGHAESLRVPLLHIVYTIPPYLSVLGPGAGALMGGAIPRRLVSTHIFKSRRRDPDPAGLDVLRTVVTRRFPDWPALFQQQALDQLAISSGGDLREFFRLIRLCLPAVRDDSQLPLSSETVKLAENAARTEMLPIPAEHVAWLKCISQTHDTCLQKDADLPTLAHFLDNRLVMTYRNGEDWYDVHPLLREIIDAHVDNRMVFLMRLTERVAVNLLRHLEWQPNGFSLMLVHFPSRSSFRQPGKPATNCWQLVAQRMPRMSP